MIDPFTLPLTRDQFADALKRGHGRALMHVRAHGLVGMENLFLHACAHNLAWDQQCHGSRDPWLMEMLVASGDEALIASALRFPHDELRRDDWRYSEPLEDFNTQMLDLLQVFKEHPDAHATPTMLFCYEYLPCPTCRRSAPSILLDDGAAPDWLLEECRHDASDDIRQLVAWEIASGHSGR